MSLSRRSSHGLGSIAEDGEQGWLEAEVADDSKDTQQGRHTSELTAVVAAHASSVQTQADRSQDGGGVGDMPP